MISGGTWLNRCTAWNSEPTNPYPTKEEIYQLALLERCLRAFDFIKACRHEFEGTNGKSGVAYDCLSFQLLPPLILFQLYLSKCDLVTELLGRT